MDRVHLRKLMIDAMVRVAGILVILTMAISSYAQNIKKKNGLYFQVPEDWPIEKRGGILAPIPTEEYVSIKFKTTEKEFQMIRDDLTNKFEELQLDIKTMEIKFSKEVQKMQVQADSQSESGDALTDLFARLNMLESEIRRLDIKITTKVAVMKVKVDEVVTLTGLFEKRIKALHSQIKVLKEEINYISDKQEIVY